MHELKNPLKNNSLIIFLSYFFLILIYFLKDFIPKKIQDNGVPIYVVIAALSYMFRYAYFNFNNAIKSFEEGIELPNQINNSIVWNNIDSIKITDENIIIDIKNKGTYTFLIDDRDIADANNIKNQFEKNTIAK